MKPLEFKIFFSVESYDECTAKNDRNYNVAEKNIVSNLSKISIRNLNNTNWRHEWRSCQDGILSLDPVFLSLEYFILFLDLLRCAEVHETLSLFSKKKLYGFINIKADLNLKQNFLYNHVQIRSFKSLWTHKKLI